MNGQKKLTITIKELGFLTIDLFEQIVAVRSDLCEVYVAKCTWVCGSFFLE